MCAGTETKQKIAQRVVMLATCLLTVALTSEVCIYLVYVFTEMFLSAQLSCSKI